jgi:hypothetical protein
VGHLSCIAVVKLEESVWNCPLNLSTNKLMFVDFFTLHTVR